MRMTGYKKCEFFLAALFLVLFAGCAARGTVKNQSDEQVLRERVMAYWGYKVEEKFDKSYEYEYPQYRKNVSLVNYLRGFQPTVRWTAYKIEDIAKKDDAAEVTLSVDLHVNLRFPKIPKPMESDTKGVTFRERWIKVEGVWYHVPQS